MNCSLKHALLVLLAMAYVGVAFAQQTPYPKNDADWPGQGVIRKFGWMDDNRTYFWSVRDKNQGAIVFVGDSLTGNWKELAKAFPGQRVANRGIGGDVSRGLLFRFQEDVLDLKPKAVVILIGLNDLTADGHAPDTLANIATMLEQAQKHNAAMPVVLCTIPETHHATAPVKEPQRLAINEGIRKLAEERENVTLCDLAKALLASGGSFDAANFGADKLHLGAAGYERWAAALQPIFVELKVEAK